MNFPAIWISPRSGDELKLVLSLVLKPLLSTGLPAAANKSPIKMQVRHLELTPNAYKTPIEMNYGIAHSSCGAYK